MSTDAIISVLITLYFFAGIFIGLAWARFDQDIAEYLKPPVCFSKAVRYAMIAWVVLWPLAVIALCVFRNEIRECSATKRQEENKTKSEKGM